MISESFCGVVKVLFKVGGLIPGVVTSVEIKTPCMARRLWRGFTLGGFLTGELVPYQTADAEVGAGFFFDSF